MLCANSRKYIPAPPQHSLVSARYKNLPGVSLSRTARSVRTAALSRAAKNNPREQPHKENVVYSYPLQTDVCISIRSRSFS